MDHMNINRNHSSSPDGDMLTSGIGGGMIMGDDHTRSSRDSPLEGWTPFGRSALPSAVYPPASSDRMPSNNTLMPPQPPSSWTLPNTNMSNNNSLFASSPRASVGLTANGDDGLDRNASSPTSLADAHRMAGRMSDMYSRNFFTHAAPPPTSGNGAMTIDHRSHHYPQVHQQAQLPPSHYHHNGAHHGTAPLSHLSPSSSSAAASRHAAFDNHVYDRDHRDGYEQHQYHGTQNHASVAPFSSGIRSPAAPSALSSSSTPSAPWSMQYNTSSFMVAPSQSPSASPRHASYATLSSQQQLGTPASTGHYQANLRGSNTRHVHDNGASTTPMLRTGVYFAPSSPGHPVAQQHQQHMTTTSLSNGQGQQNGFG
jgi:hypothetical protein